MRDTLLQLFLVLTPVLLLQISGGEANSERILVRRLVVLCAISMMLCIEFAFPMDSFYMFDMRIVPYLVGVLYGGYRSAVLLTILYFGVRYYLLGGGQPFYVFLALHAVVVPAAFLLKKRFQDAAVRGKIFIAVGLNGLATWMTVGGILYRKSAADVELSGEFYLFLAVFSLMMWSASAWLVSLAESSRDRIRLREREQEQAQQWRQLIDVTPANVVAIDISGNITTLNAAFMEYFPEYKMKDLIGMPYAEMTAKYGFDAADAYIMRALEGEYTRSKVDTYHDRTFVVSAYPLKNTQGGITGAVSVTLEVTELLRLRREISNMERVNLVGQMAASITHEIRNPMAVIRGFTQLMREKGAFQDEYVLVIQDELDRANSIIDDFLSLAQNRIVAKQRTSLNEVVEQLAPLLTADANMRGHQIEYRLDPDMGLILMNEKEIKQLLLNLVRNGMEAMDENGPGTILVETRCLDGVIELAVSDTGPGIAPEARDKLFEPFFTTKLRGTGLGLTVCLSIVEQHGGRIEARSAEGKGTEFVIQFMR